MDFVKEINDFKTVGAYSYKFDSVENVIAQSSSVEFSYHYLALPLSNLLYDNEKIESNFDVNFSEFVTSETTVPEETPTISIDDQQERISELEEENQTLKSKLNSLIEKTETDDSAANAEVTKQIILDLRVALKQGQSADDFLDEFPYEPKERE